MTAFLTAVALGFAAVTLLPGGLAHLARLVAFADLIRSHGLVAPRWAGLLALAVTAAEVTAGGTAAAAAVLGGPAWPALVAGVVLGPLFVGYLTRLLARGGPDLACGCTPLAAPLTRASLLPGAALALTCGVGLVAGGAGEGSAFGTAWGATLAAMVLLVPTAVPAGTTPVRAA